MKNSWLPPEAKAFERLNVRDGLLIDADKWRLEHSYLRKRQSYHYQSLNQAGIVAGLEVNITTAPNNVRPEHRSGRWIELSPGVALDHQGNIIVVPNPTKYRIDGSVPPQKTSQTIYLVLRYRDPDDLYGANNKDIVTEQFRLDEKSEPPTIGEIEICRFEILPDEVELKSATNVFEPGYNTLDLRYRQFAHWRAQGVIKTSIYNDLHPQQSGLSLLLKSLKGLYPFLEGDLNIDDTFLTPEEENELFENDLLYLSQSQFSSLEPLQLKVIQKYLSIGGTILIDGRVDSSQIAQLESSKQELATAIAKIAKLSILANRQQELQQELSQINQSFEVNFQQLQNNIKILGSELTKWENLPVNHPLKTEPFLFIEPPIINQYQTQIYLGEGIILLLGNLSDAWALAPHLALSREILRNAQEMGVNILHYAWRRKLLNSLQKSQPITNLTPTRKSAVTTPPTATTQPSAPSIPTVTSENPVSLPTESAEVNSNEGIAPPTGESQKRKRPKPSDIL